MAAKLGPAPRGTTELVQATASRLDWTNVVENVISARSQSSGHLTPLVFRGLSERKLADIRRRSRSKSDRKRPLTAAQYIRKYGVQSSTQKVKGMLPTTDEVLTSRFRGVHRTATPERWEAQARVNGRPTSLGCFNSEEKAARMYDKMHLWINLNEDQNGGKLLLNFPREDYDDEVPSLMEVSQEELLMLMRKEGRAEGVERQRQQKEGHPRTNGDAEP